MREEEEEDEEEVAAGCLSHERRSIDRISLGGG